MKLPAHVSISWIFLILIGIVFGYSCFFYPDSHPIDCLIKNHTGKNCPSCGFSRSFSHYTHFQFTAGKNFNPLSWPVFLFFVCQLCLRSVIILYYHFFKKSFKPLYIKIDVLISISGFLLAFLPLLFNN